MFTELALCIFAGLGGEPSYHRCNVFTGVEPARAMLLLEDSMLVTIRTDGVELGDEFTPAAVDCHTIVDSGMWCRIVFPDTEELQIMVLTGPYHE